MKKFYGYLFYWVYNQYWKRWGERELPAPSALIVLSGINGFNILIILFVLDISEIIMLEKSNLMIYDFVIIYGSCLITNHFLFLHKKRYLKIIKQFENESDRIKKKYTYLIWLYLALTITLLILLLFLASRK